MIDLALNYSEQLIPLMRKTWFDDFYKYYNVGCCEDLELSKDTRNTHQFVSVDTSGEVLGYISYHINRNANYAFNFGAIRFSDKKLTFGRDVFKVVQDIFNKFHFNKLELCVVIGNPAEKSYDRLVKKYGGSIVGVFHQGDRLVDGLLYDVKYYEIMRSDFERSVRSDKIKDKN